MRAIAAPYSRRRPKGTSANSEGDRLGRCLAVFAVHHGRFGGPEPDPRVPTRVRSIVKAEPPSVDFIGRNFDLMECLDLSVNAVTLAEAVVRRIVDFLKRREV